MIVKYFAIALFFLRPWALDFSLCYLKLLGVHGQKFLNIFVTLSMAIFCVCATFLWLNTTWMNFARVPWCMELAVMDNGCTESRIGASVPGFTSNLWLAYISTLIKVIWKKKYIRNTRLCMKMCSVCKQFGTVSRGFTLGQFGITGQANCHPKAAVFDELACSVTTGPLKCLKCNLVKKNKSDFFHKLK